MRKMMNGCRFQAGAHHHHSIGSLVVGGVVGPDETCPWAVPRPGCKNPRCCVGWVRQYHAWDEATQGYTWFRCECNPAPFARLTAWLVGFWAGWRARWRRWRSRPIELPPPGQRGETGAFRTAGEPGVELGPEESLDDPMEHWIREQLREQFRDLRGRRFTPELLATVRERIYRTLETLNLEQQGFQIDDVLQPGDNYVLTRPRPRRQ